MLSSSEELQIAIVTITILMVLMAAFMFFLFFVFQMRKRKAQIVLQKEILAAQIEIQEQTFKNISQEIHDNVGQVLSLAKLNLTGLFSVNDGPEKIKIDNTRQLIGKAIVDLRNLSRSMHGDKISEIGLQAALENELALLQHTGHYKTSFEAEDNEFRLPAQSEIIVFRMVQEAITNCIKHAKAKHISVTLKDAAEKYMVLISDDGIGFDTTAWQSNKKGIGLKNMLNRVALINGSCSFDSIPGNGTTIKISLNK